MYTIGIVLVAALAAITGIVGCWALTIIGHVATALPSSNVMNWRHPTSSMGSPSFGTRLS
jgi:hypothetical protein